MKILVELRPALAGHAGIPHATRLLFRGLSRIDELRVEGLLQSSNRVLTKGARSMMQHARRIDRHINRMSRVVISLQQQRDPSRFDRLVGRVHSTLGPAMMLSQTVLGLRQRLTHFDGRHFKDFIWRDLFAKSLPHDDFDCVTSAGFRVAQMPWTLMHASGLATKALGRTMYPHLDTSDFDAMIAETPYPGRVSRRTRLVIRYHDAIPLLMPHTISDKAYHQASHYNALRRNVRDGAWFVCVSDSTRRDLLSIFPEAEPRAVTIHNMLSHHFYREESSPDQVPEILRTRSNLMLTGARPASVGAFRPPLQYLLMVSTIEPRKNHLSLLAAWERLRSQGHPDLQLVFVGMLGWSHDAIVKKFQPWLARGGLHLLEDVPGDELRLLYRHATATVCPSFGEGFDYSGVEAMRCGGVVAASDIAVHHDIFRDAAEYFSPYSTAELAQAIEALIGPGAGARREALLARGADVSGSYLPERVLPQWHQFLRSIP